MQAESRYNRLYIKKLDAIGELRKIQAAIRDSDSENGIIRDALHDRLQAQIRVIEKLESSLRAINLDSDYISA
jgi:hypothetical protein